MLNIVKGFVHVAICAGFAATASANNNDVAFPGDDPIRIVVPYSAGGGTDLFVRILSDSVSKTLNVPIVILNKPGASTAIGMKAAISAKPDGHTLVVSTNASYSLIPYIVKPQPYDPTNSLEYVAVLGETPMVLTTNASMPNQFSDFIKLVNANSNKYSYATYGIGSSTHMAAEMLMSDTGMKLAHIPYKGVEAVTALAGEQVNAMVDGVNAASPMIKAGKIKPLVILQNERSKFLPETPTLIEMGFPKASISKISYVMAAPKGTPKAVINRLSEAFAQSLKNPDVIKKIELMQTSPAFLNPVATNEFVINQTKSFNSIIDRRGIKF